MPGWTVCPIDGVVVADAALHATWHTNPDPELEPPPVDQETPDDQ